MLTLDASNQVQLFEQNSLAIETAPFRSQLLKWVGNKQSQAPQIIANFPTDMGMYYEPFLGSGGILGVLAPKRAVASDVFKPLVEIWQTLSRDKELLKAQYAERHALHLTMGKAQAYAFLLKRFNQQPNGADLLFLCRACYGGVVRFRKNDGHMSTPVGVHEPISPASFAQRVDAWSKRTQGTTFEHADFAQIMMQAKPGDLVYCDPPYVDSQSILYGAQSFSLNRLYAEIERCARRGVRVALSIDGSKQSGKRQCDVAIPDGLFKRELQVSVGRSMLKRFQMEGASLQAHHVNDRLLLTY
jgi:DNA adenine methylase